MEYSPGTTQYNGDGRELLQDLERAGFTFVEISRRNNVPTLVVRSFGGEFNMGIQRENGSFVLVSVDDSVNVFARRVEQRRETETEFKRTLVNPITSQTLERLTIV